MNKDQLKSLESIRKSLEAIAAWEDFPATGKEWKDGTPVRFGIMFGVEGEIAWVRKLARMAADQAKQILEDQ